MDARQIIALKIRLERRLTRQLIELLGQYLFDHVQSHRIGIYPSSMLWMRRLAILLAHHYVVVIRSMQAGQLVTSDESLADAAGAARGVRLLEQAGSQATMIMDRLERDLAEHEVQQAISKSLDLETKKDSPKGRFSVYLAAGLKTIWRKLKGRAGTIANMNTQGVAEETLAEQLPIQIVPDAEAETIVNRWVSMEDSRVRPAHAQAHGQIVRVDEAFTVGGEKLKFPGDTSLGASLGNVINCRCSAEFGVIRDGEFVPFGIGTRRGKTSNTREPKPATPTSLFTIGSPKARGSIILANGDRATFAMGNGGLTIRVGRNVVASSQVKRDAFGKWTLGRTTLDPRYHGLGIEEMLSRSIEATNRLR